MSQTITLPKSVFEELIERITRLEAAVFGKKEKIKEDTIEFLDISAHNQVCKLKLSNSLFTFEKNQSVVLTV
jgi:hypothetical protein